MIEPSGGAAPGASCWRRSSCSPRSGCGWWRSPSLLYSTTGPLIGASYTDLHARLPALRVSAVVAVARRGRRRDRGGPAAAGRATASWRSAATSAWRSSGRGLFPAGDAEVRGGAHRADPGDALSPAPHRRHPAGVGTRQRGGPRAGRRGRPHPGRHPGQRARPSRTCGSGTGSRCSRPSGSSRRSAPTTISSRWTTTATGSTGSTARSCSRRASSTPPRCRPAPSSTST